MKEEASEGGWRNEEILWRLKMKYTEHGTLYIVHCTLSDGRRKSSLHI